MTRISVAAAFAALGAAIWLGWNYAHEETSIRAPWTGAMLVAAGAAFVVAGVVGRSWRAILISAVAAVAALFAVERLVWRGEPTDNVSCDPGCISTEAATVLVAIASAALTAAGIALRRAVGLVRR